MNSFFDVDFMSIDKETQGRFELTRLLGRGAYGVVLHGIEKESGKSYAIKRVEHLFESITTAKRCLREIRILNYLQHENIVNLYDVTARDNFDEFENIVLIIDLMETDMSQVIRSNQVLLVDHHRFFVYQILRGMKYVHSANILHRDLKPANLFLNADCNLKIGDFGLGRSDHVAEDFMTEYVATRWYRAPEILLLYPKYGQAIDIWSIGCILAELITRKPLFPGKNAMEQLRMICSLIGTPSDEDLDGCTNQNALAFMRGLPHEDPKNFAEYFDGCEVSEDEIDFMMKIFVWDPQKRMTVNDALTHPFIVQLHDPYDEPIAFPLEDFEFENTILELDDYKKLLWEEVVKFRTKGNE